MFYLIVIKIGNPETAVAGARNLADIIEAEAVWLSDAINKSSAGIVRIFLYPTTVRIGCIQVPSGIIGNSRYSRKLPLFKRTSKTQVQHVRVAAVA